MTPQASASATPPMAYPAGFLGLGVVNDFRANPHAFLLEWGAKTRELSSIQLATKRATLVKDPTLIHELTVKNSSRIRNFPGANRVLRQLDGDGVITTTPEKWVTQRKILQKVFRKEFLEIYARSILAHVDAWSATQPSELHPKQDMRLLSIRMIAEMLFGLDLQDVERTLDRASKEIARVFTAELSQLVLAPKWWPSRENRMKWRHIGEIRRLAERACVETKTPFLSMIKEAAAEEKLDESVIRDEIVTLFMAGHDTTASALAWCFYRLGTEAGWLDRLRAEVDSYAAPLDSAQLLTELPEMTAFIYEVLRLDPPAIAMFTREATEEIRLGDWSFPKGSLFYVSPLVCGRAEEYFEKAERFDPSRFIKDGKAVRPHSAWIPFGVGPHICVGMQLALLEMKIILASLLKNYDLKPMGAFDGTVSVEFSIWPKGENAWRLLPRKK